MANLVYSHAAVESLAVHFIGNKNNNGELKLSEQETVVQPNAEQIFIDYFLSPFKNNEYYCFTHESELKLNEVYSFCRDVFENPKKFLKSSQQIAKHLYAQSLHPKIKEGELCIAYISNCIVDGQERKEAIAIFKSESKENVLRTKFKEGSYTVSPVEGISLNKLDKACLVFNRESETGYKLCIHDQAARSGEEAHYWKDSFLQVALRSDDHNNTHHFLKLAKSFITKELGEERGLETTRQVEMLDRSIRFFQNKEVVNTAQFADELFGEESGAVDAFNAYGAAYVHAHNIDIAAEFNVAPGAVKKQEKNYRSVIKLDRNFHIYVHGNPSLIEKGIDADGRKFYKIYYEAEL